MGRCNRLPKPRFFYAPPKHPNRRQISPAQAAAEKTLPAAAADRSNLGGRLAMLSARVRPLGACEGALGGAAATPWSFCPGKSFWKARSEMTRLLLRYAPAVALVGMLIAAATNIWAQDTNDTTPAPEKSVTQGAVPAENPAPVHKLDRGDNAWMLTSSALVLFMTVPGLAMFYGGLVRRKNVNSVIMQCLGLMAINTVLWATVGYSLAFGGSDAWIGNMDYLCMKGVQAFWAEGIGDSPGISEIPIHPMYNVPVLTHMLFQGMFFIITPALICGAYAERMKFSAMVIFSILWGLLVYCPICHWVWGGGILAYGSDACQKFFGGGALDFAGGTVVHISSGVSALVCALMLGKRIGYGTEPMPPHNLTYTALGAGMLWVGWFGFNAGRRWRPTASRPAPLPPPTFRPRPEQSPGPWSNGSIVANRRFSAPRLAPSPDWFALRPHRVTCQPMPAIVMGLAAGVVCSFACSWLKPKGGYDDSLDAFGVHGLGGTLGAILTGVFATRAVNDVNGTHLPLGLLEGGTVLKAQLIATGVTWVFAIVVLGGAAQSLGCRDRITCLAGRGNGRPRSDPARRRRLHF